jgi:DNA invertase Pin-like site-specific DNA recombinase
MEDVKKGKITKVIVYRVDRLSRSILDFQNISKDFEKHKVEFVSHTEKFDTSTPMGNAMMSIVMVFAQLERETIQQRVTDNFYERGRQGMYMGGRAPYGFRKIETSYNGKKTYTFEEVPKQVDVLKTIYDMYTEPNTSLGIINRYLNKKGIPAPSGVNWDTCKLSRIMNNPVYVQADANVYLYYKSKGCIMSNEIDDFIGTNGCYLYGKRKASDRKYTNVENHVLSLALHEGIVDSKTFLRCQHKLSANMRIANAGKSKYSWLSGKLRCGYCDSSITTQSKYNDTYYLGCTGRKLRQDCNGVQRPLKANEIEAIVEKQIMSVCNKRAVLKKSVVQKPNHNHDIDTQLKVIDHKIENLIKGIAEGTAQTITHINRMIGELEQERNRLIEASQRNAVEHMDDAEVFRIISIAEKWNSLDLDERKAVVSLMIDSVVITADTLDIKWKKAFDDMQ